MLKARIISIAYFQNSIKPFRTVSSSPNNLVGRLDHHQQTSLSLISVHSWNTKLLTVVIEGTGTVNALFSFAYAAL